MATAAFYDLKTGFISGTLCPPLSNPKQIADLEATGTGMVIIPEGKHGTSGMIDLATKKYVDFAPPPPPVPNINIQLVAALIRHGVVTYTAFHPTTLAAINEELKAAGMDEIKRG